MTPARWMDTERVAGAEDSGGEARLSHTWTVKVQSPGVPLLGVPPQRHQLELFPCYCTRNKRLYGHVRLCCGQPGVEPVKKPGLAV